MSVFIFNVAVETNTSLVKMHIYAENEITAATNPIDLVNELYLTQAF